MEAKIVTHVNSSKRKSGTSVSKNLAKLGIIFRHGSTPYEARFDTILSAEDWRRNN